MNFFWSSDLLPWLRFLTVKSFVTIHPEWEVILYTCKSIKEITWGTPELQDYGSYAGYCYFNQLRDLGVEIKEWIPPIPNLPPAHNSDLFEWDLLRSEGGFYSDLDILYISKLNYTELSQFDFVYCNANDLLAIGFLGSSPCNSIFDVFYKEAIKGYTKERYQNTGIEAILRAIGIHAGYYKIKEDFVVQRIRGMFPSKKLLGLIQDSFYPFAWNDLNRIWVNNETVPEETIGIHWFGGAKKSQEMNNLLTPTSVNKYPCTFTNYAKRYI